MSTLAYSCQAAVADKTYSFYVAFLYQKDSIHKSMLPECGVVE